MEHLKAGLEHVGPTYTRLLITDTNIFLDPLGIRSKVILHSRFELAALGGTLIFFNREKF